MDKTIESYNQSLADDRKVICELLNQLISAHLPTATSKLWHGSPVWFIHDNPLVGYADRKHHVQLLFWSGQSFDEPDLLPEGSFKASQVLYTDPSQINEQDLARWLSKAETIQWDYKNIIKRRGQLVRL